jgi:single-strand DNA-binding protein
MARSLNCVHLIGNLTRDPELRFTPSGKSVCNIRLATNRQWKTETGEQNEQTEYHTIILWGKLAEISSQYLHKGEKAYFQGRLQTRSYTAKDGTQKTVTEIIAEDMLMLSGGRRPEGGGEKAPPAVEGEAEAAIDQTEQKPIDVDPDEIPF